MMNGKIMEPHMKIMSLLLVRENVCVCVWERISTENVSLHKRQGDYDTLPWHGGNSNFCIGIM